MKCMPKYCVSYKGVFHKAGMWFEIDPKDRAEMEKHGEISDGISVKHDISARVDELSAECTGISAKPAGISARTDEVSAEKTPKRGRPRKGSE